MLRTIGMIAALFCLGGLPLQAADAPKPGSTFTDCSGCPKMVVVPPGSFTMGAPAAESDLEGERILALFSKEELIGWSLPLHKVTIPRAFAVAAYHVTRGEYGRFVMETKRPDPASCGVLNAESKSVQTPGASWHNTGYPQTDDDPVVCTTWDDATAYAAWLSQKTGKHYRLLSEAEYEYAARAGTTTARFWGDGTAQQCLYANGADKSLQKVFPTFKAADCDDGYPYTAPDAKFRPNAFGLYGMLGNAFEWTEDCWQKNYDGAPTDGSARRDGDCSLRTERGGAWFAGPNPIRAGSRARNVPTARNNDNGFRVARDL